MRDANEVAFEAMRVAELLEPDADPPRPASPFRTRTMASLLETPGRSRCGARDPGVARTPQRGAAPRTGARTT